MLNNFSLPTINLLLKINTGGESVWIKSIPFNPSFPDSENGRDWIWGIYMQPAGFYNICNDFSLPKKWGTPDDFFSKLSAIHDLEIKHSNISCCAEGRVIEGSTAGFSKFLKNNSMQILFHTKIPTRFLHGLSED